MSKAASGLFKSTIGAQHVLTFSRNRSKNFLVGDSQAPQKLSPEEIRYSQTSVNDADSIADSMREHGWVGAPIDVVRMPDGELTTLDNTRVVAAREAGIDVLANVHEYGERLTSELDIERFTTPKGGIPSTWGDAVENRIGKQSATFRRDYPNGSYNMNKRK